MRICHWTRNDITRRLATCCLIAMLGSLSISVAGIRMESIAVASEPSNTSSSADQRAVYAIEAGRQKIGDTIIELSALLCDDNATVRAAAAWACTQLGDAALPALPQLTTGLSDDVPRVRIGCAITIGHLGDAAATAESALIQAVQDRDNEVRCAALAALRTVPVTDLDKAVEAIGHCLQAGNSPIQSEAAATASVLLKHCSSGARRSLATALFPALTSPDSDVRLAATLLAGDLGIDASPAVGALVKNADDFDDTVETAAQQSLLRFAESVNQNWSRLNESERAALRRPCEVATKGLQSRRAESPELARLANSFAKLASEIQLTSGEKSSPADLDLLEDPAPPAEATAANPEPNLLPDAVTEAKPKSKWSSAWLWVGGIILIGVQIWLLRLGLKEDDPPIFIPAKPEETIATTDFIDHLTDLPVLEASTEAASKPTVKPAPLAAETKHIPHAAPKAPAHSVPAQPAQAHAAPKPAAPKLATPIAVKPAASVVPPKAEIDFIDPSVLPAVLASVPGGELPDDVGVKPTSPATTPARTQLADPNSRREAYNQLADVGLATTSKLTRGMTDADAVIRWRSASAVGAVHAATIQPLLDAVGSTDSDVRRVAATSIRGYGQEVAPAFASALKDHSAEVREAAAVALGRMGRGAVDALVPLAMSLKDPEPQVRAAAAMALAMLGPNAGRASGNLQHVLTDASPSVRARAAFALGKIGPIAKGTVPDLIGLLTDYDPSVRRAAATALGGIGADAKSAVPALQKALTDSDVGVRRCVVATLGLLAPQESAAALQAALNDADAQVRTVANSAMQKAGQPNASRSNRAVPLNRAA